VLKPEIRDGPTDLSDLDADVVVKWQHKYYLPLAIITAFVFPSVFAGILWGDWWGGLLYMGIIRMFFCYQALFFVNSIAHYLGDQPYDDHHTPRNHFLVALLCFGEGYHNYHHEFPANYRNGVRWYQYDITKWCIWILQHLGFAHGLQRAPQNVVDKGMYQ
jgi:stearoyl-CoA desaturase (delta-9 desaturase)